MMLISLGRDYFDMPRTSNYACVDGGYELLAESVILSTFLLPSVLLMWSCNLLSIIYYNILGISVQHFDT